MPDWQCDTCRTQGVTTDGEPVDAQVIPGTRVPVWQSGTPQRSRSYVEVRYSCPVNPSHTEWTGPPNPSSQQS